MAKTHDHIPGITDDPIIQFLLRGEAHPLHEAEEMYLDAAIPEILDLLRAELGLVVLVLWSLTRALSASFTCAKGPTCT